MNPTTSLRQKADTRSREAAIRSIVSAALPLYSEASTIRISLAGK